MTEPKLSEPVLPGEGGSDYERYLRTDALLALQKTADEWVHRDELLFQTVHQSSELWLKLAVTEVAEAARLIDEDTLGGAIRLMRRGVDCLKIVTGALDMLEHLSPWEYQEVRKVLGHGSGFDSPGFRGVQKVSPVLGAAFHAARERDGLTLPEVYTLARERAGLTLAEVYTLARDHEDLYQLAELLIEWDERVVVWRARHFVRSSPSRANRRLFR